MYVNKLLNNLLFYFKFYLCKNIVDNFILYDFSIKVKAAKIQRNLNHRNFIF